MKTCNRCHQAKPRAEFYAHPQTADRLLGQCKACKRGYVAEHREANRERVRAHDRERGCRMTLAYQRSYHAAHPGRAAATSAVARALRAGALVKPAACWHCGRGPAVAHHADYSLPLAVSWLCQACHKGVHRDTEILMAAA